MLPSIHGTGVRRRRGHLGGQSTSEVVVTLSTALAVPARRRSRLRSAKPGSSRVGTGPFAVVDPDVADRTDGERPLLPRPTGDRSDRRFKRIRACGRRGRNCSAAISTCCTKSASTRSIPSKHPPASPSSLHTRHYQYIVVLNTQSAVLPIAGVRRALNAAVDRDMVVRDALNGHGVPSSGPVWPQHWAFRPDLPQFQFDPAAAAATWPRQAGEQPALVRFTLPRSAGYRERAPRAGREATARSGRRGHVRRRSADWIASSMRSKNGDFDAVADRRHQRPNPAAAVSAAGIRRAPFNCRRVGQRHVDAALDASVTPRPTRSTSRRSPRSSRPFVDDPPAIFLAWSERARAVSSGSTCRCRAGPRYPVATLRLWQPVTEAPRASRN